MLRHDGFFFIGSHLYLTKMMKKLLFSYIVFNSGSNILIVINSYL